MSVISTPTDYVKYQLMCGNIVFPSHTFVCLLMRNGFVFDASNDATKHHWQYKNINTTSGTLSLTFNASAKTIVRGSGSFLSDGFVAGNMITISGASISGNNTVKYIASISSDGLTITCSSGDTVYTETHNAALASNDELASGSNYNQGATMLSGGAFSPAGAPDATNHRGDFTWTGPSWTAGGGAIGPTPGAIIYDSTDSNKTILGYIDFGGAQTAVSGVQFVINGVEFRLN